MSPRGRMLMRRVGYLHPPAVAAPRRTQYFRPLFTYTHAPRAEYARARPLPVRPHRGRRRRRRRRPAAAAAIRPKCISVLTPARCHHEFPARLDTSGGGGALIYSRSCAAEGYTSRVGVEINSRVIMRMLRHASLRSFARLRRSHCRDLRLPVNISVDRTSCRTRGGKSRSRFSILRWSELPLLSFVAHLVLLRTNGV